MEVDSQVLRSESVSIQYQKVAVSIRVSIKYQKVAVSIRIYSCSLAFFTLLLISVRCLD